MSRVQFHNYQDATQQLYKNLSNSGVVVQLVKYSESSNREKRADRL